MKLEGYVTGIVVRPSKEGLVGSLTIAWAPDGSEAGALTDLMGQLCVLNIEPVQLRLGFELGGELRANRITGEIAAP